MSGSNPLLAPRHVHNSGVNTWCPPELWNHEINVCVVKGLGEGRRRKERAGQMVHCYNPRIWEVEAGTYVRFLSKEGKEEGTGNKENASIAGKNENILRGFLY